jgi:hypothetical protein
MRKDINHYIQSCPICQKLDQRKYLVHTNPFVVNSNSPFQEIAVDTIGPFVESNGYKYILVIICTFSRFVELYPITDTSALSASTSLLSYCGRYGVPAMIRSDNGSQFINELIRLITSMLHLKHNHILPYSKEENGLVERANKEVNRHLRAILLEMGDSFVEWSKYLPLIQRIMNSSVNSSIGLAPSQIIFGGLVNLNRRILHPVDDVAIEFPTYKDYYSNLLTIQGRLIAAAEKTQNDNNINKLKLKDDITIFNPNSYVLVSYPDTGFGTTSPSKLHPRWRGPYRVLSQDDHNHIEIIDLVTNKIETVHVTRIKPYIVDPYHATPLSIALKDDSYYLVDSIINHRGNSKQVSRLSFKVRWTGYSSEHDTWEPYKTLKHNEKFHSYLREKNMHKLILDIYRNEDDRILIDKMNK